MHALQEYIAAEMLARKWSQADLSRASGLSPAHISKMMKSARLAQMPDPKTVAGLAKVFGVDENTIRRIALEAMGVDLSPLHITREITEASDDELLTELASRLRRRTSRAEADMDRPLHAAARRTEDRPSKKD